LRDPGYLEVVSRCYREAIEAFREGNYDLEKVEVWKLKLASVYNRGFSTGFYFGSPGFDNFSSGEDMNASRNKRLAVGVVVNYYPKQMAAAVKLLEEGIKIGDEIIIEGSTTYLKQQVKSLKKQGKYLTTAEKGVEVGLAVEGIVRRNDRIFIIKLK